MPITCSQCNATLPLGPNSPRFDNHLVCEACAKALNTPPPAAPPAARPQESLGRTVWESLVALVWACAWAGGILVGLIILRWAGSGPERFDGAYTPGATANAQEATVRLLSVLVIVIAAGILWIGILLKAILKALERP